MVFGRRSGEEGEDHSRNPNASVHLRNPKLKIKKDEHYLMKLIGLPGCKEELEALLRKVVREEVSQALRLHSPSPRLSLCEAEPFVTRSLRLCFNCRFPNRVFTGNKIEAEGPNGALPLKVELLDADTGAIVSDGPLSSMRLECVVLHGDFKAEELTNWTDKEFNNNILREREGRRPLLIGERFITLNDGVAFVKDVSFTDNSSWVRSKRFRLGVKVAQALVPDVGVQEAVSSAFEVRDRRGEPYQKHGTPSLEDEVWRLSKIAKDGPHSRRLAGNGICTVKDFLQRYYVDSSSLRSILGVPNKVWDAIVGHAKSCLLNNDRYSYFSAEEGVGLLLNSVLNIVGVTYDGQNYQQLETLTKAQKLQVDKLRRYAYQNQNLLIPTDVPATTSVASSPCDIVPSTSSSLTDLHYLDVQDQPQEDMNFNYPDSPLPQTFSIDHSHHLDEPMADHPIHVPYLMGDAFNGFCDSEPSWAPNLSTEPSSPNSLFFWEDNMFDVQTSAWFPVTPTSELEGNGLLVASTCDSHIGILSPLANYDEDFLSGSRKSRGGWSKVRAAMLKVLVEKDGSGGNKGKLPSCCC